MNPAHAPGSRLIAAVIAAVAFGAVALQYARVAGDHDALGRLWVLLRYFTILTNLLVGATMLALAAGGRPSADLMATVTLGIVMVGGIYHALLAQQLSGLAWWADQALHTATPVLTGLWWLAFGGHGLRLSRLWVWLLWPFGYCLYALGRGLTDGTYPYFFVDVGRYGWAQVGLNIAGLVALFALAGLVLWGIARALGRAAAA